MRDGIRRARRVNLLSAVTSEIRHETSDAEIRHFATLLNSGNAATRSLALHMLSKERGRSRIHNKRITHPHLTWKNQTMKGQMKVIVFEEH
jgi:hypothetical protein